MDRELTPQEYKYLNPLLLAYIGDAVYELKVREHLLTRGSVKMNGLHQQAVSLVNAGVSAAGYRRATGVEALIGWLHLCGQSDRLEEIFRILFETEDDKEGQEI